MKKEIITCDISDRNHSDKIKDIILDVIFDHDQEDGKSKTKPYFKRMTLQICSSCEAVMMNDRKYVYGYGAMGYNTYRL